MTPDDLASMLKHQRGHCAICQREFKPGRSIERVCVDHEHASGRVRGLLCGRCNSAIGFFLENANTLRRAIVYLRRASSPESSSPDTPQMALPNFFS